MNNSWLLLGDNPLSSSKENLRIDLVHMTPTNGLQSEDTIITTEITTKFKKWFKNEESDVNNNDAEIIESITEKQGENHEIEEYEENSKIVSEANKQTAIINFDYSELPLTTKSKPNSYTNPVNDEINVNEELFLEKRDSSFYYD